MSRERIQELQAKREAARKAYYLDHEPLVPDEVYDAWGDELQELEANNPEVTAIGASAPSAWVKVRHEIPMGSLEKINTLPELTGWAAKVSSGELLVTEKLDGISVAIQYENGAFVRAVTRGDGVEGDDISANVARMMGIPGRLPKAFTGQIRGEIICTLTSLARNFPNYANPRNTASGISNRLDSVGCEHLTVMVYQVAEGLDHLEKRSQHIEALEEMGFVTPNWCVTDTVPGVNDVWVEYQQTKRAALDYAIDGLVVEVNDIRHQLALGETSGRPHGARAFKFAPVARETTLRSIENETAATGRITPVAIFDEVNLLGTRVTRASLYNWKYIRDLKLGVGCKILVARANDVIPRVVETTTLTGRIAEPPTRCSACGTATEWDGEYLVCPNAADCPAQAQGRLVRYIKVLNILEWGEAVLERLVASSLVIDIPDLYRLKVEDLSSIDRMGTKSATKLIENLHAKSPVPIEQFFGALSIPGCGESMLTLVVDAGYDTVSTLTNVTYEQLLAIPGLGPVRAKTLVDWFAGRKEWIAKAGIPIRERVKGNLTGKSFCFTGKTRLKRGQLEDFVRNAGGIVKGSAGKGLTYLVMSDPNSGSTKAQAAKKNGTHTLSEDEFLRMVGYPAV